MHDLVTLREVYDAHFRFVWRSLRRLGVCEQDAPDCAQKVFLVVHQKLPEFRHESKVTTWLFGICMRVVSEHHRRRTTHCESLADDDWLARYASEGTGPARSVECKLTVEQLLDGVPPDQCAVFVMFEAEEMSTDEIAEVMGIPVGTVKSRLRLARACIARRLSRVVGTTIEVADE